VPRPDVLVASDLPLQGPSVAPTLAAAVLFVLRSHGFRAGRFTLGYQSCDDSTARAQASDYFKCAANARDFASAERLVAVIGPYDSPCAQIEVPVTNRSALGPLALVSPSNTWPGLTRAAPYTVPGEPGVYYPTGVRSYFRLAAPDDVQGAGDALLARGLGAHRVAVLTDGEPYGNGLASGFRTAARRVGIAVPLSATWVPGARASRATLTAIARARVSAVLVAGFNNGSGGLVRALRRRFGTKLTVIAGDGFLTIPQTLAEDGPAADGMLVSVPVVVPESLTSAGRRVLSAFDATQPASAPAGTYLPEALEAAEVVVDAIARSNGTRASVLHELGRTLAAPGLLGGFSFDREGDMTPAVVTILRVTGGRGATGLAPDFFRGAVVDRTIRVPVGLLAGSPASS
jgi:branched-chain amino acid transport system substrate-binding protein